MADLEAQLPDEAPAGLPPGTRLPGFVSAGVIQQQDQAAAAAADLGAAPAGAALTHELLTSHKRTSSSANWQTAERDARYVTFPAPCACGSAAS